VYGLIRRNSITEHQQNRIESIRGDVYKHYGDLLDACSIDRLMREARPHEIYNLAAQSHVRISFEIPQFTVQANALGTLNMLESMRNCAGSPVLPGLFFRDVREQRRSRRSSVRQRA
jgi:GDPmannose 4,6-dehydratase